MKRHGHLWANVVSFEALLRAAEEARRGKRFRPAVAAFHFDQERELWKLHEELTTKTYRPGAYRTFFITEPKRRQTRLIVIWDHASWHAGRPVADWVAEHNRGVKGRGGVEIVLCPLPVMSPWLNNIETRWGPAKRAILEPDRILTGQEIVTRVYQHFGCEPLPSLKSKMVETAGQMSGA